MRFSNAIPLLALCAGAASAASDYENAIACAQKDPNINAAIDQFCNKKNPDGTLSNDIVVPSSYGNAGASVGGWTVAITASCNPPQWVPLSACSTQFHELCANSLESSTYVSTTYGWEGHGGNCQTWSYWKS